MKTLLTTLHSKYIHASLALPGLAAFCGEDCGELLINEYTVHEPKQSVLAQIISQAPDVVAFSVYLWNRAATLELVACLKQVDPQLRVVLGGPEVSFEADDFFQRYPVDALICGEGELPLRHLLRAWQREEQPADFAGLRLPTAPGDNGFSQLESLDLLPSPFAAGLVDLSRGLVYYESSRGCPYDCSFCMSSLDDQVRSFSMERIVADLRLLIDAGVPQVKFVDRTFNYHNQRSREIFTFLVQNNRVSHFHFEIGAHLLDEATLQLLETVPEGVFQFEIGVQSTLPETLRQIGRRASLERLAENVRRLRKTGNIHLHLDLIAGLPGEDFSQFMRSIDWTAELRPHHLQLEPVKLLPGAPLRAQADNLNLHFDPNPPYTVLRSAELSYAELEKLRGIGRLLDLLYNSGRFTRTLELLKKHLRGLANSLVELDSFWRREGLYRSPLSLRQTATQLFRFLQQRLPINELDVFREALTRDYALSERVVNGSEPEFIRSDLSAGEILQVRTRVKEEIARLERSGKVQYFAAPFHALEERTGRTILIFLYLGKSGERQQVVEVMLP